MSPRNPMPLLFALCLAACGGAPESPADQLEEIRSRYAAELNGFAVHQVPVAAEGEEPMMPEGAPTGVVEEAAEEVAGEEAMPTAEPVAVRQDVILDILLSRESREALPGITVDIEHVGPEPERAVKATHRAYLDTSDVLRGAGTQVVYRLEDVDYQEGDGFHVEIRHPIPAGERGEYREFQEFGGGQT